MDETRHDRGSSSAPPSAPLTTPSCDLDRASATLRARPTSSSDIKVEPAAIGAEWHPPQRFDEYCLVRPLGAGAMGQVFLAHDQVLDRPVAVKFVADARQADAEARGRLLTEARAIARLQHPNVVAIFRVSAVDGRPYLVSEFVRGQRLDEMKKPMPWQKVLGLGLGLSRGLASAHRRGVLHRDIKLANAILSDDDGEAKLLDFGLAKLSEVVSPSALTAQDESPRARGENIGFTFVPKNLGPVLPPALTSSERLSKTGDGAIVGSPRYLAPELWTGEPASCRSDVYALGVVLFYLCAGRPPHVAANLLELKQRVLGGDVPALSSLVPNVDPGFAAVVDLCLKRDPSLRFQTGDDLREALERLTPEGNAAVVPEGNPYRGLSAFHAEHRALFFGRGAETRAILDRLRAESFVLVAGDSGVGKSSICHAGVVPRVDAGALGGGRAWSTVTLVPGRSPVHTLCAALSSVVGRDPEMLFRQITKDDDPLERTAASSIGNELRARQGTQRGLLVFVDQFEELITISDPAQAGVFSAVLSELVTLAPGVRILGTVRADFLARVAPLPGLGSTLNRALYVLQPLSADGIREAIVGPARAKGVSFETDAVTLLEKSAQAEGSLPLLQFALAELWEKRDPSKQSIPLAALATSGGVEGALARHADAVIQGLLPVQRVAARQMLTHLVTAGGTRTRRTEAELVNSNPDAAAALDSLVRGRLVATRETDEGTSFDLAHEALIHGWSTLHGWLNDDRELRAAKERLAIAASEWERLAHNHEALWSEPQLAEWAGVTTGDLPARDAPFLRASRSSVVRRRHARRAAIAAVPAILAVLFGGLRFKAHYDLNQSVEKELGQVTAPMAEAEAQTKKANDLRKEAYARFDAGENEKGERLWDDVLALDASAQRAYAQAMKSLETVLMLDPTREDARRRLAGVFFARALLAEQGWHLSERDGHLQRLELYDHSGDLMKAWNAPGRISLSGSPRGAAVTIRKYVTDEHKNRRLGPPRDLGALPASVELEPGSYSLSLSALGHEPVRYPVLVARDERLDINIDLPKEGTIPPGFVYIPPGRFLYGSAGDSETRAWFQAVPIHELRTTGYLIGRTEVTFAEWLEYLDSLSGEERIQRTPGSGAKMGFDAALQLSERGDGPWELSMQQGGSSYRVLRGERLSYASRGEDGAPKVRSKNGTQDWLRFPVMAISASDAEAYASWLRTTGRMNGARLCDDREWERAGRGADDREFAHGDELYDSDANYDVTHGRILMGPDEVASHPASDSPFGISDMVGNVWEWATTSEASARYVVRGGSYYHNSRTCRLVNRNASIGTLRDATVGVRICATPSWNKAP